MGTQILGKDFNRGSVLDINKLLTFHLCNVLVFIKCTRSDLFQDSMYLWSFTFYFWRVVESQASSYSFRTSSQTFKPLSGKGHIECVS
jgi:hypothetical protein